MGKGEIMSDDVQAKDDPVNETTTGAGGGPAGLLVDGLAALPAGTILDAKRLAGIIGVTPRTISRMIGRNELPPPVTFAGHSVWLAGRILAHIEAAADRLEKEGNARAQKIQKLLP